MPRQARKKSASNVYHVMMRGVNRQSIFEDEEDCSRFFEILRLIKKKSDFKVIAWCLMSNHVHLLIQFGNESLEKVLKKIDVTYAVYYNKKNEKLGPVFADRFRSEPVEDDAYLITVARYIHRNPLKAGVCKDMSKYQWSSYPEYALACGESIKNKPAAYITDTAFLLDILGKDEFIKYTNTANDDECLEMPENVKISMSDGKAREIMLKKVKCSNIAEFKALSIEGKIEGIKALNDSGLGISQITRLTGVSRPTVYKYLAL